MSRTLLLAALVVVLSLATWATASADDRVIELISAPGAGASGPPDDAGFAAASADGSRVFFETPDNLVGADTDGLFDIYERSGGTTVLVSAPGAGASGPAEEASFEGASVDGTRVFFETNERLVAADTDGLTDVYERSGGVTTLVSAAGVGASGAAAGAFFEGASADGTRVFFFTDENLRGDDTDGLPDVYERSGGVTTLVSAPGSGASGPAAGASFGGSSSDGTHVFFDTDENLVGADTNGVSDVYERFGGTTTLVSGPGAGGAAATEAVSFRDASADGTRVFLQTRDPLVGADTDDTFDVYEHSGGTTTLVSAPGAGASGPAAPAFLEGLSEDGTRADFETEENLVSADTDGVKDVYERSGGTTSLVSAPGAGASGAPAEAFLLGVSTDGSKVFFGTNEDLVAADTDGLTDIYERSGGATTLVSVPGTGAGGAPNAMDFRAMSADGSRIFFETGENLVGADGDGLTDVYERSAGVTSLITSPGAGASGSPADAILSAVSTDGAQVFFITTENLVAADTDGFNDVYSASIAAPIPPGGGGGGGTAGVGTPSPPAGAAADTRAPNTKLRRSPKQRVRTAKRRTKVTFRFSSTERGSHFECKLDRQRFKRCHSPKNYRVKAGRHVFRVRAIDAAGNRDATPAKRVFRVVRQHR